MLRFRHQGTTRSREQGYSKWLATIWWRGSSSKRSMAQRSIWSCRGGSPRAPVSGCSQNAVASNLEQTGTLPRLVRVGKSSRSCSHPKPRETVNDSVNPSPGTHTENQASSKLQTVLVVDAVQFFGPGVRKL